MPLETASWPVKPGDEIGSAYFEDIRKRIFVVRNPNVGNITFSAPEWLVVKELVKSWEPGECICTYNGEIFVNPAFREQAEIQANRPLNDEGEKNAIWEYATNPNRYYHHDFNSQRYKIENHTYSSPPIDPYVTSLPAHRWLPMQVDPMRIAQYIKYTPSGTIVPQRKPLEYNRHWLTTNCMKTHWKRSHTPPAGCYPLTEYIKQSGCPALSSGGGSDYFAEPLLGYLDSGKQGMRFYVQGYQDHVAWTLEKAAFYVLPVDDVWIANHGSYNPLEHQKWDYLGNIWFGCNASAFEKALKHISSFDWWWDNINPYWTAQQQQYQNGPLGCWRRTWRYTFGEYEHQYYQGSPPELIKTGLSAMWPSEAGPPPSDYDPLSQTSINNMIAGIPATLAGMGLQNKIKERHQGIDGVPKGDGYDRFEICCHMLNDMRAALMVCELIPASIDCTFNARVRQGNVYPSPWPNPSGPHISSGSECAAYIHQSASLEDNFGWQNWGATAGAIGYFTGVTQTDYCYTHNSYHYKNVGEDYNIEMAQIKITRSANGAIIPVKEFQAKIWYKGPSNAQEQYEPPELPLRFTFEGCNVDFLGQSICGVPEENPQWQPVTVALSIPIEGNDFIFDITPQSPDLSNHSAFEGDHQSWDAYYPEGRRVWRQTFLYWGLIDVENHTVIKVDWNAIPQSVWDAPNIVNFIEVPE